MRGPLLALLLTMTALAGCADDAPKGDELKLADGTTIELGEGTSDTKGAIAGYVVDEAIRPLAGVVLSTGERSATTDDDGFFLLGELEPGFYALTFSAEGFLPTQSSADVVAGETATLKVLMPRDLAPQPYHQTYPYSGYMQAWGTVAQWAVEIVAQTPLCDCVYSFQPDGNVSGIVLEAFWDPTVPDPAALTEFYWEIGDPELDWYETGYCTDPCRVVPSMDGFQQGRPIEVRINGPDAWVAYQQKVEIYTTVFYHDPAPEGWSILDAPSS